MNTDNAFSRDMLGRNLNLKSWMENNPNLSMDPTGHNTLDDYAYQKQITYHPVDGYSQNSNISIIKQKHEALIDQSKWKTMEKMGSAQIEAIAKNDMIIAILDSDVSLYAVSGATDATLEF